MTSQYRARERRSTPARNLPDVLPEGLQRRRNVALEVPNTPFVGVTEDGTVAPGLFRLADTGLSLEDARVAANLFLANLTPQERDTSMFPLDAPEWRQWSNIHPFLSRHGLLLETLGDDGRERALGILRATLSPAGFTAARDVMRLNETIREITQSDAEYGEWLYWLSVMGDPSNGELWGWQLDGHHLNVNCMLVGGQLVATPAFLGSEPVIADAGKYAGTAVFRQEEAQGYALMSSLTSKQRQQALIGDELPGDVFTTAFRDNFELHREGIPFGDLSSGEQDALVSIVETYVGRMRADQAALKMDEVKAHLNETTFAWIGSVEDDAPFYYRVHSPVVVVEFDHQSGTALDDPKASRHHIHSILRTPNGNDYGADLLRQHHEHGHAHS
jgi:hypothetical protein